MTPMSNQNQGFLTVSYYSWDKSNLKPADIDTSLCTHLILGFTDVEDSLLSKGSTDGEVSYRAVAGLKAKNPSLKVMLSVGGGSRSESFHNMVTDPSNTDRYVDFINLMTYDLHLFKWYYPFSGHNSPLYGRRKEIGYFATLNMASSAKFWLSRGMPNSKIIVGIPTYGLVWKLCHRIWHGVSCLTLGKGTEGGGYISYPEVCKVISNGGKRIFDKQSKVPYVVDKKNWISYDDVNSVELKARWILSEGFGGIMTFSLNCDDHTGATSPGGVRFPLHKKIKEVVEQVFNT